MSSAAIAKTMSGIRSALATIRWIMRRTSEHRREEDRPADDDPLPGREPVLHLEPGARLALVDVDRRLGEAKVPAGVAQLGEDHLGAAQAQERVPGDRERALLVHR